MSNLVIVPKKIEGSNLVLCDAIEKVYDIGGEELRGYIGRLAVGPLRILTYVLSKNGIGYQTMIENGDLWRISRLEVDDRYFEFVKEQLKEIMEYRLSPELEGGFEEIIRQLPFDVALRTSDNIMNFGKKIDDQYYEDQRISDSSWASYGKFGNPNNTVDNLIISQDQPKLRRHLIYKSARGGYNIKTKGYNDRSLEHYCYMDSGKYD